MASSRSFFMDALNIVACFAVVVLHCTTLVFAPSGDIAWIIALLGQSVCIFAVPVFFMVSGANLLNYRSRYSTKVFFKKRFSKVLGALLFASIVSYVVLCAFPFDFYAAQGFAGSFGIVDFVKRFLTNDIVDVYWFMYAILYLYLLTPIFSKLVDDKRSLQYVLALCFFVAFVLPFVNRYMLDVKYTEKLFGWPLFGSANLLYFVLGYYLNAYCSLRGKEKGGGWASSAFLAGVAIVCMMALGYLSNDGGQVASYDSYWVGIESPFCVLLAGSLFLLFKRFEPFFARSKRLVRWLPKISGVTLWVYLFHMLVINWISVNAPASVIELFRLAPLVEAAIAFIVTLAFVMAAKAAFGYAKKALKRTAS